MFKISPTDVLRLLTNIGEVLESKAVHHMDNYIHKAVNNFIKVSKLEESDRGLKVFI